MIILISEKHDFLFIHIPKTGGNSIQDALKPYAEDKIVCLNGLQDGVERFELRNDKYKTVKHSTLINYKDELEPEVFDSLTKFTTIRNPWDRCISYYFSPHRGKVFWDRELFLKFIETIKPNSFYIGEYKNIDHILRFENLENDFNNIIKILNLPKIQLAHRNATKSKTKSYVEYYDDELIKKIENLFKDDIQFGEYTFSQ